MKYPDSKPDPNAKPDSTEQERWKLVYIPVGVDDRGEYIYYKTAVLNLIKDGEKR